MQEIFPFILRNKNKIKGEQLHIVECYDESYFYILYEMISDYRFKSTTEEDDDDDDDDGKKLKRLMSLKHKQKMICCFMVFGDVFLSLKNFATN